MTGRVPGQVLLQASPYGNGLKAPIGISVAMHPCEIFNRAVLFNQYESFPCKHKMQRNVNFDFGLFHDK